FLFQESHLIDGLSAIRNVTLPSTFSRSRNGRASYLRAEELLERLGIPELATVPVERLSGGQRQRVCVARALVEQPELLLCDEPTANLDVETGEELLTLLEEQNKDHGLTVVAVSHEAYVSHIADRVLNLANGVLVPMDNPCGGDL
ncbi:MAG: ATP-binding cassette domain-containing protein, partial [bacterium]|nr:ATP-binding cassette domain-containing protein [bacterium]